ncbi:MAG: trypsin-like peptidase domain-containing protein [Chloroflexota bacterium]
MKRSHFALVALCLLALGATGGRILSLSFAQPKTVAAATTSQATVPAATSQSSMDRTTEQAYATASAFVIYIENTGIGSGSGIIYDSQGDIVTNNHVVAGATNLRVTLNDGRTVSAQIVGVDKTDDLAVIRIHASGLTAAHFAPEGGYRIAETVLAVGSPLGLKQSVVSGLISGLHRVEQEPNGAYLADAIQTSAPINPGNSGGALVGLDGTVVGIPTLEQTSSTGGTTTQAIGFAIPAERVVLIAGQLIGSGRVQHTGRAYLGIAPTDLSGQMPGGFDQGQTAPTASGALVAQVESSGPAARAGIKQGDVITQAGSTTITSAQDLLSVLAGKKPGEQLTVKLDRSGATMTVFVRLNEMPA